MTRVEDVAEVRRDDAGHVSWLLVDRLRTDPATAARVLLAEARGQRVVTEDDALVAALVAGGGTVQRRGHDYEYDVASAPAGWANAAPDGYALTRDVDPAALVEAHTASTPPGHPDHDPELDHLADLRAMVEGRLLGPLVRPASWQVDGPGGAAGAILVTDRPGPARRGWVVDVFLHPDHQGRGLGRVLLQRAVAGTREAGIPVLGLVVSDGNPARRLYESVGFRHLRSGTNVDIPLLS
ncbi:MAG TPA: GNAT family N-acetyltransferase [Mycobacteriales bacterium]